VDRCTGLNHPQHNLADVVAAFHAGMGLVGLGVYAE